MYIWQVKNLILVFLVCISISLGAQDSLQIANKYKIAKADSLHYSLEESLTSFRSGINKKKLYLISGIHIASYASTLFILGETWYKDYPRTSFHTFNDSKEWLQVDKVGHAWTAYNIAKNSASLWRWTGLPRKKSVLLGGITSIGYQSILEYLDAHSAQWGWSWTDMAANVGGTGLYVAQDLAWKEQRIVFKFSAHKEKYENGLLSRADGLYGKTLPERILKDYNGQTYWFSGNINSFFKKSDLPSWVNVAVGYGGKGLFGGFENRAVDNGGNITFDRRDIQRQRQWYLSPDIDFTRIKTGKKGLKVVFAVLNLIKLPAPALELSGGKLKGHLLYF